MKAVQHRRKQIHAGLLWPLLLGLPVLLWPWLAIAAPSKDARVFVLIERSASFYLQASRAFRQKFAPDVSVTYVDGDTRELNATIEELRKEPPQLVVVFGTQVAIAARTRLRDVPIIYCLALNPLKNDLAGSNIGGIRLETGLSEQFADVERFLPQVTRIGTIYSEPESGNLVRQARASLRPGVQLIARDARDPRQAAQLIEEIMPHVDAFCLLWDPAIANVSNFRLLVDLSLKNKVALIAPAPAFVEAGALMSVAADYEKAGQRASEMARLVLEGGRAGDFGAEPPPAYLITINASVARRLGIVIPPGLPAELLSPGVAYGQAPGGR
jgi:ABC-type uncharacterized transport system substrate-binding protein